MTNLPRDEQAKLWDEIEVAIWNEKRPIGTPVRVRLDDGSTLETVTRSEAWQLGDGTPVVLVKGITGGYALSRVTPIETEDTTN